MVHEFAHRVRRQRDGKSTLFREFARRTAEAYIEIEGLAPHPGMTNEDQLGGFAESLARETSTPIHTFSNWLDAFFWLDQKIDDTKRTVVVLDEISWMGGYDKNFPSTLRKAWERYFHRHEKLILVVCGSVSAWSSILGLQFENLIVNNAMELLPFLHLGNAIVESAAPYRNARNCRNGTTKGFQVDLLIQTARTVYVVEVKRRREIAAAIESEVEEKIGRLPLRSGISARPVLVYDGELAPSVEGSGFFDAIVPAAKLLGLEAR